MPRIGYLDAIETERRPPPAFAPEMISPVVYIQLVKHSGDAVVIIHDWSLLHIYILVMTKFRFLRKINTNSFLGKTYDSISP